MQHQSIKTTSLYYGFPVILLTTEDPTTGIANITPLSSSWSLIDNIIIGLAQESKAFQNIQAGSEAIINVVASHQWEQVEKIAQTTGMPSVPEYKHKMGYTYDADKFKTSGFTPQTITETTVPAIAECPLQLHTKVDYITEREQFAIIELRILQALAAESILKENGEIDVAAWSPLIYKFRAYASARSLLGYNFRYQK